MAFDKEHSRESALSYGLLTPSGLGNLGDAAILQSVINAIRRRIPEAAIYGITLNPADTQARFGVPSFPIAAAGHRGYGQVVRDNQEFVKGPGTDSPMPMTGIASSPRYWPVPVLRAIARVVLPEGWPWRIRLELSHWRAAWKFVKSVEVLVVAGGGQLDDYWGGTWGHPYALWKWSLLARVAGKRMVVLSVGFGSLGSRLSRMLVRQSMQRAQYRSYRDEGSKQLMQMAGFRANDPVLPDLAFGLTPIDVGAPLASQPANEEQIVCVSPMIYHDPRIWPDSEAARHTSYVEKLVETTSRLLDAGCRVVLVVSDTSDECVVHTVLQQLAAQRGSADCIAIEAQKCDTVATLLAQMSRARVTIASRLHGVLLSFVASVPVVALAYDRKVVDLMEQMQMRDFCLDIDAFAVDQVVNITVALCRGGQSQRDRIVQLRRNFSNRVAEQYDNVFGNNGRERTQ